MNEKNRFVGGVFPQNKSGHQAYIPPPKHPPVLPVEDMFINDVSDGWCLLLYDKHHEVEWIQIDETRFVLSKQNRRIIAALQIVAWDRKGQEINNDLYNTRINSKKDKKLTEEYFAAVRNAAAWAKWEKEG